MGTEHKTDRFTRLMIFACDHDFPVFAAEFLVNYKSVMGVYQGIVEESYVVNLRNVRTIMTGGMLKGQESVLFLAPQEAVYGGQRDVYLVKVLNNGHLDCDHEFLGKWCKVSVAEALHSDAWTCDTEGSTWYVAKMPETDL